MDYKVSAFKVIINGVIAFDIYIYIYLADWDWLCELLDYTEEPDIISCATGDLIGKLINKLDDHFWADYDINLVSSQITIVTLNKVGIVLTFASSDLGLYITYL